MPHVYEGRPAAARGRLILSRAKAILWCLPLLAGPSLWAQSIEVSPYAGFGSEGLHWSISGNLAGTDPNIYSELRWKRVCGPAAGVGVRWRFAGAWSLSGAFERMFTLGGEVRDRDYHGDDRTLPAYDAVFSAGDSQGYADNWWLLSAWRWRMGILSVFPALGYGQERCLFFMKDADGVNPGLNSSYRAVWGGPLCRVKACVDPHGRVFFSAAVAWGARSFHGSADWNLVPAFRHPVSFTDKAKGYLLEGSAVVGWRLTRSADLQITGRVFQQQTGKGRDMLYLADGQVAETRLNGAEGTGIRITARLNCCF